MNEIKNISNRLQLIASQIPKGSYFADIGSDHAYLPTYICLNDQNASAIAGEVNDGPFNRAKEVVENYNLTSRITVKLGDGLDVIANEQVDTIVIAGMGGSLIKSILEHGKDHLKNVTHLILQPNIDEYTVRKWLLHNGYQLSKEILIHENGHYYEVLVAVASNIPEQIYVKEYLEKQLLFGPFLLQEKSELFIRKWKIQSNKLKWTINQINKAKQPDLQKINEFTKQLKWIKEVIGKHD